MKREVDLGRKLADTQAPEDRVAIEADPWSAIPALHELQIEVVINLPGGCSIDGHYDRERRLIKVVDRWSDRRMAFTLLHELGHHLLRGDKSCVSHLASITNAKSRHPAEEAIADAFAAEVLIPTAVADEVLGGGIIRARSVAALFEQRPASRSACAVRASQACKGSGYVVVSAGDEIVHAAPFGQQQQFRVRRGTRQPGDSVLVLAAERERYQGLGRLTFPSGATTPFDFHVDAVTVDGFTFAIFSDQSFSTAWSPPTRPPVEHQAPEVSCTHCGETAPSWRRCERCNAFACADCGSCPKCSFKKAKAKTKYCPGCFQTRPIASFSDGAELCDEGIH